MQLSIEREAMITALTAVMGAVATKNTIPVLSNVLLHADGDRLHFSGTDLDVEITTSAAIELGRRGTITAPGRDLFDIARRAPAGAQIVLKYEDASDGRIKITAGRSNYAVPVLPAGDFPTMSTVFGDAAYRMLGADMSRLIDKTAHAASTDETRFVLTGAFLHTVSEDGSDYLRMVTTDGHRLALAEMPAPDGSIQAPGVVIPRKTIGLIRQIIEGQEWVELTISKAKIAVRCGDTALTSKLIDGSFVDYTRVIPRGDGKTTVSLNAAGLARSIDAASIVLREKKRFLNFDFTSAGLKLDARNEQGGQADAQLDTEHDGDDILIGLNARNVQELASVIGDVGMVFHIADPTHPVRVTDASDSGVTFVVTPCRT